MLNTVDMDQLTSSDGTTWNLPEGAMARFGRGKITDLAFSPDGESLAVATAIGCWLYELPTMKPIALWETERGMVATISFSPNGKWFAASNSDGIIKIWETETHRCTACRDIFAVWKVSCLRFLVAGGAKEGVYPFMGGFHG